VGWGEEEMEGKGRLGVLGVVQKAGSALGRILGSQPANPWLVVYYNGFCGF